MTRPLLLTVIAFAACSQVAAAPNSAAKKDRVSALAVCPTGAWNFEDGAVAGATLNPNSDYHNVTVIQPLKVGPSPSGSAALTAGLRVAPGKGGSRYGAFSVKLPVCAAGQTGDTHRKKFSARFYLQADRQLTAGESVEINVWPHLAPLKNAPIGSWATMSGELATATLPASLYAGIDSARFTYHVVAETPLALTVFVDDITIAD